MKKVIIAGTIFFLLSFLSCAKNLKEKRETIQHRSYTTRFIGYKTTVEVKASPEQLEQYLMNPKNIILSTDKVQTEVLSENKFEKLGDTSDYQIELLGIAIQLKSVLVYYQPGQALWYLSQGKGIKRGLTFLRLQMEPAEKITRVTLYYHLDEEVASFVLKGLIDIINLPETMAEAAEIEVAQMQVHFCLLYTSDAADE